MPKPPLIHPIDLLLLLTLLLISGTTVASGDISSPLATWDPSGSGAFHQASAGTGTLKVTSACTWLEVGDGKAVLLVWPEPASWNSETEELTFVDYKGETITLKDGDAVTPGGAESSEHTPYVLEPDPTCKSEADSIFVVNTVSIDQ